MSEERDKPNSQNNLKFIDTHCHIHDRDTYDFAITRHTAQSKQFKKASPQEQAKILSEVSKKYSSAEILKRATVQNLNRIICIGTNYVDSLNAAEFAAKNSSDELQLFWSYGVHPEETSDPVDPATIDDPQTAKLVSMIDANPGGLVDHYAEIKKLHVAEQTRLVAIGEVGLDYSGAIQNRPAQIKLLELMLDLAQKLDLPLIFHVREAFPDLFDILNNFSTPKIRAVVHSFSDSSENLTKCLDRDFYIGVNGLATFAKIPLPPLERILLETDAPFLAPEPHRGAVNEPAFIPEIANFLSQKLQISLSDLATVTNNNATTLFHI